MSKSKKSSYAFGGGSIYKPCHHNHPALKLPNSDLVIYGGSCITPTVLDADVYIGFDSGMRQTAAAFPWNDGSEVYFRVRDMGVPEDAGEFRKLVHWTIEQLKAGKKVHAGCIGGHGRTGTFFAALVAEMGELDAIPYVRKHYCPKAVESSSQTKFLSTEFGVKTTTGSKDGKYDAFHLKDDFLASNSKSTKVSTPRAYEPIPNRGCIW